MKKVILSMLLSFGIANAGLIDAIALTVNDEAITLFDIEAKAVQQTKGDKNKAVGVLIDEMLYKQELKKHHIEVTMFDVNDYLKNLAAQNGMDLYQFKAVVRQQYNNFELFEKEIKEKIQHERLLRELVKGNIKVATKEDLLRYYNNNKEQFKTASKFEVTQYSSKNRDSLAKITQNRMLMLDGVKKENLVLEQSNLNPQMKYILNSTKVNDFTPIFTANQQFVVQLVDKKEGETVESFETAENKIFNIVMGQREEAFLKDYFEKLKLTADIKVIR